jgi:hypothetical protein
VNVRTQIKRSERKKTNKNKSNKRKEEVNVRRQIKEDKRR